MPTRTFEVLRKPPFRLLQTLSLGLSSFRAEKVERNVIETHFIVEVNAKPSPERSGLSSAIARLTFPQKVNSSLALFEGIFHFNVSNDITQIFFLFSHSSTTAHPRAQPGPLALPTPSHSAFCVVVETGGEKSGRWMVWTERRVVWGEKGQRREVKINTEHPKTEVVCRCLIHTHT